jgi:general secretion pathway protein E
MSQPVERSAALRAELARRAALARSAEAARSSAPATATGAAVNASVAHPPGSRADPHAAAPAAPATAPASAARASMTSDSRLPFTFARRHGVLVRSVSNGIAECVYRAPCSPVALAEARRYLQLPMKLSVVSTEEFEHLLRKTYEGGSSDAMQLGLDEGADLAHLAQDLPEQADLLESNDDAPIIRLINALLTQAIRENASDIHIEPFENRLVVRFRVDGILREVLQSKRGVAPLVVSRIKVMSKLDIAEKRLPQDGRISLRIAGRAVDVRVSTIPSGHGERVVLRLLDKQAGRLELESLGMQPETLHLLDELIHKPHGILLVTGPTGSGKTTTLYAALERLNDNTSNIMTVEDPIEYYIDGIGQTQVNTKVEMTFARGLRAILRQDPDVVLVGEIRDLETAQIAVQASLTGHLVLSTLHTNTAAGALTRLRDMGIEPFLLSSSLIGVLAQRLVRVLDPATRQAFTAGEYERRLLSLADDEPSPTLYRPGRDAGGGYRGRTGIYELIVIDDTLRTMIHDGAGEHDIERYARKFTPSIREDGLTRVLKGETTVEEVLRVTRED